MEYIIGAAAVIAVIFAGAYIMQKKADKKLQERIKNSFGKIPELEYTHEKYESIGI